MDTKIRAKSTTFFSIQKIAIPEYESMQGFQVYTINVLRDGGGQIEPGFHSQNKTFSEVSEGLV